MRSYSRVGEHTPKIPPRSVEDYLLNFQGLFRYFYRMKKIEDQTGFRMTLNIGAEGLEARRLKVFINHEVISLET